MLRNNKTLQFDSIKSVLNIDGKPLKKDKTFGYENEAHDKMCEYFKSVEENKSFMKAELDFTPSIKL